MKASRSRRHRPQSRDALGVYAAMCLMCACDTGIGEPLTRADGSSELGGQAGSRASRDGGPDYDYDMDEATRLTDECAKLDAKWPEDAKQGERELVEQMNKYRQMPSTLCGGFVAPAPPLEVIGALQCVARQRTNSAVSRNQPASAGYTPAPTGFSRVSMFSPESANTMDWREKKKTAGLDERSAVTSIAEVVFSGASSVGAIAEALKDDTGMAAESLCPLMFSNGFSPGATAIGAGRSGNVWVLDFGGPRSAYAPRPGTSGR